MTERLVVAGVCERDIDLLMLEEFHACPSFQRWFLSQTSPADEQWGDLVTARRSVTQAAGESDLEVMFAGADDCALMLLIENKINAGLQPAQAARYRERGSTYLNRQHCTIYRTIIVAPERYFAGAHDTKGFDAVVTYETLRDWFTDAEHLGRRREYKLSMLQSAIDKARLGYQPDTDQATTDFWRDYWALSKVVIPHLEMPEPGHKPAGSTFVQLKPPSMTHGFLIYHKLTYGAVDFQIRKMGDRLNELEVLLAHVKEPGMSFIKTAGSAAVRFMVPKLDPNAPLASQALEVEEGMRAASRLAAWYVQNKQLLTDVHGRAEASPAH